MPSQRAEPNTLMTSYFGPASNPTPVIHHLDVPVRFVEARHLISGFPYTTIGYGYMTIDLAVSLNWHRLGSYPADIRLPVSAFDVVTLASHPGRWFCPVWHDLMFLSTDSYSRYWLLEVVSPW